MACSKTDPPEGFDKDRIYLLCAISKQNLPLKEILTTP